jgi:hypothetical protein
MRCLANVSCSFLLLAATVTSVAWAQTPPPAVERMLKPGPEEQILGHRVGTWDVTITFRATPDAPPVITKGVIAERKMVVNYLEEVMKPAPGSPGPDFRRISYLYYSKVEGRWQYVSMDTRLPVGIMPAQSFGKGADGNVTLTFDSIGFVGFGKDVEGRMIRSSYEIARDGNDHEVASQHWVGADGTSRDWLAVQYEYTRRR